ncbi:MAG: RdgB/HAM1 family non-canonical purine NTP pyrophosphatase [Chloroflexota bacterium]
MIFCLDSKADGSVRWGCVEKGAQAYHKRQRFSPQMQTFTTRTADFSVQWVTAALWPQAKTSNAIFYAAAKSYDQEGQQREEKWKVRKVLIGSNNPGKLREIQALVGDMAIELLLPKQLALNELLVEETGSTYAENAALKARAFAKASGLLTLADDSGLEVEALDGAPGVYSARYSGVSHASDADRRTYLLAQLKGHPRPWKARFCCTVALAIPDGQIEFTEGICPGEIIPDERGSDGFGYDPIFLLPSLGRTMAELSMQEKNTLSHRARAVAAARPMLAKLLAT